MLKPLCYLAVLLAVCLLFLSCSGKPTEMDDTQPPIVIITNPTSNTEFVAGTLITLHADASDNVGVACVEFYTNGVKVQTDSLSPYECNWNTEGIIGSQTIYARAHDTSNNAGMSDVVTVFINEPIAATPTFSPQGGVYSSVQNVNISSETLGATIRYTTDGSEPTEYSTQYTSLLNISTTTTLKAKAYRYGWIQSATATASYTIELPPPPENFVFVQGGTINPAFGNYTSGLTVSAFYINIYEITNYEWEAVMGGNNGYHSLPHAFVSWYGAIEYCNLRSIQEGLTPCYSYLNFGTNPDDWPSGWDTNSYSPNISCNFNAIGYRLPTAAEWEYAARGGLQTHGYVYSGGNYLNSVGWYSGNSASVHAGGQLAPNELGTYDMSGNLWEWGWDTDSPNSSRRILRGGSFDFEAYVCTVSHQGNSAATHYGDYIGFRVCRSCP